VDAAYWDFRALPRFVGTYGDAEARPIVENCGNTLILRCSASENGGYGASSRPD